jgi:hypothetical protein
VLPVNFFFLTIARSCFVLFRVSISERLHAKAATENSNLVVRRSFTFMLGGEIQMLPLSFQHTRINVNEKKRMFSFPRSARRTI